MLKLKNYHLDDDHTSQIVSWGHWFALFNIFIAIILGSRYFFIADWPATLMGRFYAIISGIGHFSFLTFVVYLILLFPLSFFIRSIRCHQIIATAIATICITLLLIDIEVFNQFRMHLSFAIWNMLISSDNYLLSQEWQKLFIFVPFILLIEIIFAIWSWRKLRSLKKRRKYAKPIVVLCVFMFLSSHFIHIWADAQFYRPITMQRTSLPLSYPLTARHFLERYGWINEGDYEARMNQEGNPFAIAIEYPIGRLSYQRAEHPYNILMVVVRDFYAPLFDEKSMPVLQQFANEHTRFESHYSSSNQAVLSEFSLFYGLDTNYFNSILASHKSSALLNTIVQQRYNLGLFSSDGFAEPLYRYALLSDFSMSAVAEQSNPETTQNWTEWFENQRKLEHAAPWFSILQYDLITHNEQPTTLTQLTTNMQQLDQEIERIITSLKHSGELDRTMVIITGTNGLSIGDNDIIEGVNHRQFIFDRSSLHVPLIVARPNGVEPSIITTPTTHVDIMTTVMQDILQVTSPVKQYSQGQNLYADMSRNWLIVGSENRIAAINNSGTVVIDDNGSARIYDTNNKLLDSEIGLSIFLQIVTENRRFMVTN